MFDSIYVHDNQGNNIICEMTETTKVLDKILIFQFSEHLCESSLELQPPCLIAMYLYGTPGSHHIFDCACAC